MSIWIWTVWIPAYGFGAMLGPNRLAAFVARKTHMSKSLSKIAHVTKAGE